MSGNREFHVKFQRAQSHMHNLNAEVTKWLDKSFDTITREEHPNRPGYFIMYVTPDPIPVYLFAVLVGDILHNLRGTLDHLVYALAEEHSGIPLSNDIAKKSEFPIYGDPDGLGVAEMERRMADGFRRKIGAIHPDAQAIIKSLQPYHRGEDYVFDTLWALNELSNIDKHRLLLATKLKLVNGTFRHDKCTNFQLGEWSVPNGIIEGKAEIVTFSGWPIDASKKVHVEFQPVIDIIFTHAGPLNGTPMDFAVKESVKIVANILGRLDPFL